MSKPPRQGDEGQSLEALNALEPTADRAVQNALVQKHLENRHFRVVAKAARLAEGRALHERVQDLLQAYPRFTVDPVKRDPKCIAKVPTSTSADARAVIQSRS